MSETCTFHYRIDEGEERQIAFASGIYRDAVAAMPAVLDLRLPFVVEIWCPHLTPEYGPYFYRVEENEYGNLVVRSSIRFTKKFTSGLRERV